MARRALIVSWEYPPLIEGGLARHVRKLAEALVSCGVEVDVLTRGRGEARSAAERGARGLRGAGEHGAAPEGSAIGGEGGEDAEDCPGAVVHRIDEPPWPRNLDRFLDWVKAMNADMLAAGVKLAEQRSYDLVHGHDWLVASASAELARRMRVPYVTTIHATEHGRHQGWVNKAPQSEIHAVEGWMARRADAVIVCSHYMRGHVADVFDIDEERIAVIPNGIDPRELQPIDDLPSLRAKFAAPDERLLLLVGRLVYEKGFQLALQALPSVMKKVGGVRYLVAGSGTHETQLKQLASELGLREHGTFLGWIGDDALHSLYRIADLCVVPSLYEPFGLVALEAMASGCPCIVADTGGLREVVPAGERVGLRFNGGDPEHLGFMIERVLEDQPLRERLVAEASEHVLSFDWLDVAQRTNELYGSLGPPLRYARAKGWRPRARRR